MQNTRSGRNQRLRAWRAVDAVVTSGMGVYERKRLSRLIAIGPDEINAAEPAATRLIVLRLAQALRGERARGKAGHWTYDLNRHIGLAQAYRSECERLEPKPAR